MLDWQGGFVWHLGMGIEKTFYVKEEEGGNNHRHWWQYSNSFFSLLSIQKVKIWNVFLWGSMCNILVVAYDDNMMAARWPSSSSSFSHFDMQERPFFACQLSHFGRRKDWQLSTSGKHRSSHEYNFFFKELTSQFVCISAFGRVRVAKKNRLHAIKRPKRVGGRNVPKMHNIF